MNAYKILKFVTQTQKKVYFTLLLLLFIQFVNAQNLGALEITPAQYALLPRPNWTEIKSYSTVIPSPEGTYGANGITMLNNPPIGDQGTEGSCVGWAIGYTAMGVLTFPKFHCWDNARRSPNYVYNQIKINSNCGSGAYPTEGLNLVKNQGDCSWNLMPYIDGNCATQPNTIQRSDAAQNKAVNWAALNINDVSGIKLALDLGFPVVTAFRVTQAFDQMGANGGIWNTNFGTIRGGHATCIVGYDDIRQQFKVQNQWGNFWGDNGYYWVTYDLVRNNCYEGLYIVYGNNGSTTLDIIGDNSICSPATSANYSVSNLACNSSITWSCNISQVTVSPTTGANTTVYTNGYSGSVTLTATVVNSSGSTQIIKPIQMGTAPSPNSFIPYLTVNGNTTYMNSCNQLSFVCTPNNSIAAKSGDELPNIVSPNSYCATGYITDPNVNSITWNVYQRSTSWHSGYSFNGNQFSVNINANYPNEWVILQCTRTNSCGSAYSNYKFYVTQPLGGSCGNPPPPPPPGCPDCVPIAAPTGNSSVKASISPNPSNGQFAVTLINANKLQSIKEVIVKNKMGFLIYRQKFNNNQKQQTINLTSKAPDVYMVEIFDGENWFTQKLSLQQ